MSSATPRIVLTGASGYIGRHLAITLKDAGYETVIISRHCPGDLPGVRCVQWDGRTLGDWAAEFEGAAAVINLAGRSVNCRYTPGNKAEIRESRVVTTTLVREALAATTSPPPVWLNAASATIYRDARDRPMDEATGELGHGFSVDVCQAWEKAFLDGDLPRTRRVALRMSMVFSPHGPVLEAFSRLVRMGLGGPQGDGGQSVSWIHATDLTRAVLHLIRASKLDGQVNVCSPNPLPNRDFMRALRQAHGVPFGFWNPAPVLAIGAVFLKTETELILKSRQVVPGRLLADGFTFNFPTWPEAARDLVKSGREK